MKAAGFWDRLLIVDDTEKFKLESISGNLRKDELIINVSFDGLASSFPLNNYLIYKIKIYKI